MKAMLKKKLKIFKSKLEKGVKTYKIKKKLLEEEKIIQQKKIISAEEYKKEVSSLREKVSSLQKKEIFY